MAKPEPPRHAVPHHAAGAIRAPIVPVPPPRIKGARAFRRRVPDRILGTFGVLLIVLTAYLFFHWETSVAEDSAYRIAWPQSPQTLLENETGFVGADGPPDPGQNLPDSANWANHSFTVDAANLTRMDVQVTFQDDIGMSVANADTVEVTLRGPNETGIEERVERLSRTHEPTQVAFSFLLNPIPNVTRAPVATEVEARAYVANQTTTLGQGVWTVTVHLLSAAGTENVLDNPLFPCNEAAERAGTCRVDRGEDFQITVVHYAYAAAFAPDAR